MVLVLANNCIHDLSMPVTGMSNCFRNTLLLKTATLELHRIAMSFIVIDSIDTKLMLITSAIRLNSIHDF